jgi:hypothetical protein
MKSVSVIFTEHEERGLTNVLELLAILTRIKPEVIFLECPAASVDSYFRGIHAKLEPAAVNLYREMYAVDLVPVDLPTPEATFFSQFRELIDRIARVGPDYDRIASWHGQYVSEYGFAYLNSEHCSDLFATQREVIGAAIGKLADPRLANIYDSWTRTNARREDAMLTNIEDYCRVASFSRAVFLVGAAHRQSILDLSASESRAASSTMRWDFASAVAAPNLTVGRHNGR